MEFFTVHQTADIEHTAAAAERIARSANSEQDQELCREQTKLNIRSQLDKFNGIYEAYA